MTWATGIAGRGLLLIWADGDTVDGSLHAGFRLNAGGGELHLFARDRHSPVFTRIIELAQQHRLPLLLHGDPAVIDTVYEQAPGHPVIWAHAGTFPYPDLIADYLARYPALCVDLSVRFGSEQGHAFVNAVLDRAAAHWRKHEGDGAGRDG